MPKLKAPKSGVTVRMYRPGHGDCFLLALPRQDGGDPVYLLIDCGFKPGSEDFIHKKPIADVVKHLGESTGHRLDVAIITHEHEDHVNGFKKDGDPLFEPFHIERAWLAWTENPADQDANALRKTHHDQLLNLVNARRKLALAVGDDDLTVRRVDMFLSLALGGEGEALAAADPAKSKNKQAMKLIKDKASANSGISFLNPGDKPIKIPGTDVRVFVLGPPRSEVLLRDEDPHKGEGFPDDAHGFGFGAAAAAEGTRSDLFSRRFSIPLDADPANSFITKHYGRGDEGKDDPKDVEAPDNAAWRRIDSEWLFSAENLALKLTDGINNTSLVLAFELPVSRKVLFFVGDAQRGNWVSWTDHEWTVDGETITARDLLARTVLYKVGHHGSHNATLDGDIDDTYPNLSWMATGTSAGEFTAMITAVNAWAETVRWRHPWPSIKTELISKTQGRVFQTDTTTLEQPSTVTDAVWKAFLDHTDVNEFYFDYTILDS